MRTDESRDPAGDRSRVESSSGANAPSARLLGSLHGLLALATALVYANSLDGAFVFDDLTEGPFQFDLRPVFWATIALNRAISETDTTWFHAVNIVVHAGTGLLLFGFLRRTLDLAGDASVRRASVSIAFTTSLLWLVHPLQTESVTYICQRVESIASFFYLATLFSFVRFATGGRAAVWATLALASFALGMATKEIVATAPILILLYDGTFLSDSYGHALRRRKRFYLALLIGTIGLSAVFISGLLYGETLTTGFALQSFTSIEYARTQPGVILHYLRLIAWPDPLCLDYLWPAARTAGEYVPQSICIAVLVAGTIYAAARRRWLGFVGAWFFVILSPTSSFVPIADAAFEHRVYLAMAAVLVLVVLAGRRALLAIAANSRVLPALAVIAVAAALGATTVRRNEDYASKETMNRRILALQPDNHRALNNLAAVLLPDRIAEAIELLERSVELEPRQPDAFQNLGNAYLYRDDPRTAREWYRRALVVRETGAAFHHLGDASYRMGDYASAEDSYRRAVALEPEDADHRLWLANTLRARERFDDAVVEYEASLRLRPDLEDAHTNLGGTLLTLGRRAEGLAHFRRALAILPNSAGEHRNLGRALIAAGETEEGVQHLREAIRIDPEFVEACEALSRFLVAKPQPTDAEWREAVRTAETVARLTDYSRPRAIETLAVALAGAGDLERAASVVENALERMGDSSQRRIVGRLRALLTEYRSATNE